jgi:hypothetical protein
MTKKIGAAALAVAVGLALSSSTWAAGVKAGTNTDANATVDTSTTGAIAGTADVATTVSAINSTSASIDQLKKLQTVKSVKVMKLDAAANSDAQFKSAMDKNKADTASLRTTIQANANLQSQLQAQNVTLESIVAIEVDGNGNVIVYTQS